MINNAMRATILVLGLTSVFALPALSETEPGGPDEYKFNYTPKEVKKFDLDRAMLQEKAKTLKVHQFLSLWKTFETPNLVHPPAFTYDLEAGNGVYAFVNHAVLAALVTDKFIKKDAKRYSMELKKLKTEAAVVKAVHAVYDNAGFGYEGSENDKDLKIFANDDLAKRALRVFEKKTHRTLYGGMVYVTLEKSTLEATVVLVVDLETSEISAIAHGDLFDSFSESTESDE